MGGGRFLCISGGPGDHPPFMETRGNSGTLGRSAYTFKECNNINSLEKKTFTKSLGGAWPPWPRGPLATPLVEKGWQSVQTIPEICSGADTGNYPNMLLTMER